MSILKNPTHENVYRWNLLPDEIIENILSRIGLSDGYDFTVSLIISATTFDIKLLSWIQYTDQFRDTFQNLLTIFTSPSTTTFRLQFSYWNFSFFCWEDFINTSTSHLLRRNNIQHLEIAPLGGTCYCYAELDARNIFQMHSLVSLDLDKFCKHGFNWKIPPSINLPNLKKLTLHIKKLKVLERIIKHCPSLEDLTTSFSTSFRDLHIKELKVSTKKLKQLHITVLLYCDFVVIIDAPNLEHLKFGAPSGSNYDGTKHGNDVCMHTINSVSYVKSLVLNIGPPVRFYSSRRKTDFPNLTHLTLIVGCFERFEVLDTAMLFPNLEVVVLKVTYFRWDSLVPNAVRFRLFKHVKQLELSMKVVRFEKQLLNFVIYLLRNTPVLETLSLSAELEHDPSYNKLVLYDKVGKAQFFRAILECSRTSGRSQIEFLGAYKPLFCTACSYDESIQPKLESI